MDDFTHSDSAGDKLRVAFMASIVEVHVESDEGYVEMDRPAVRELYDFLALWLNEQVRENPQGPTPDEIRAMAQAEFKRLWAARVTEVMPDVLPLWQSLQAAVAGRCADHCLVQNDATGVEVVHDGVQADPEPHDIGHPEAREMRPDGARCRRCGSSPDGAHENCAGDERACQYIGPNDAGYEFLADPEAWEVQPVCNRTCPVDAHPASRCTWCGHRWPEHASAPVPEEHGRLMSELPRRIRPRVECTCEHPATWQHSQEHGCTRSGCTCRWIGAGTS